MIFSGAYITRLIMDMGLLDAVRGAEKIIVPSPLSLETMRLMGMIRRYRLGVYVMVMPPLETAEGDEVEGPQPALEPQQEHMEADALPGTQEPPPVRIFSPT